MTSTERSSTPTPSSARMPTRSSGSPASSRARSSARSSKRSEPSVRCRSSRRRQSVSSSRSGKPDPIYLIVGDDEAEMLRLAADVAGLVEDELRAFNVERLYASEKGVTPASIVEAARILPMMADRRVVVVLRAERLLKPKRRGKSDEDGAGWTGDASRRPTPTSLTRTRTRCRRRRWCSSPATSIEPGGCTRRCRSTRRSSNAGD